MTSNFPPRWISEDGKTMQLVFSGDDHFSLRRMEIQVRGQR
jgi:hypothetical protein